MKKTIDEYIELISQAFEGDHPKITLIQMIDPKGNIENHYARLLVEVNDFSFDVESQNCERAWVATLNCCRRLVKQMHCEKSSPASTPQQIAWMTKAIERMGDFEEPLI